LLEENAQVITIIVQNATFSYQYTHTVKAMKNSLEEWVFC